MNRIFFITLIGTLAWQGSLTAQAQTPGATPTAPTPAEAWPRDSALSRAEPPSPDSPLASPRLRSPDGLPRAAGGTSERQETDGVYGKLDGDLELSVALGAELNAAPVKSSAQLAFHYFSTAGLYFDYREAWGGDHDPQRAVSLGVSLRPTFIPRWSNNLNQGPPRLDLTLDSLSLFMGAHWDQYSVGPLGRWRGFEMGIGLGFPLRRRAPGPWVELRGVVRFTDAPGEATQGALQLLIAWHAFVETPLLGRKDPRTGVY